MHGEWKNANIDITRANSAKTNQSNTVHPMNTHKMIWNICFVHTLTHPQTGWKTTKKQQFIYSPIVLYWFSSSGRLFCSKLFNVVKFTDLPESPPPLPSPLMHRFSLSSFRELFSRSVRTTETVCSVRLLLSPNARAS